MTGRQGELAELAELAELQDRLAERVTGGGGEAGRASTAGEALAALRAEDLDRYSRQLRRKRWDDVVATLPLSVRAIAGLETRYDAWLRAHPAPARDTVLPPGAAEALRALADLAGEIAADAGEAPWASELLVFETLGACSRADGTPRALRARHAVHEIAADLRAGLTPVDPPPQPYTYAFGGRGVRWKATGS